MFASEVFSFIKNIGIHFGDLIPRDNPYWKLVILLKDTVDIRCAPVIHKDIPDYLSTLTEVYLTFRHKLFPNSFKIKYHLLSHYAYVMRRFGTLCQMSTRRCESKNKEFEIFFKVSLLRTDICKTLAVKAQLSFSHRMRSKNSIARIMREVP